MIYLHCARCAWNDNGKTVAHCLDMVGLELGLEFNVHSSRFNKNWFVFHLTLRCCCFALFLSLFIGKIRLLVRARLFDWNSCDALCRQQYAERRDLDLICQTKSDWNEMGHTQHSSGSIQLFKFISMRIFDLICSVLKQKFNKFYLAFVLFFWLILLHIENCADVESTKERWRERAWEICK